MGWFQIVKMLKGDNFKYLLKFYFLKSNVFLVNESLFIQPIFFFHCRARFDYSSGERVGEKKIWLGYPTPKEEFNKIKKVGSQTSLKLLRK